MTATPTQSPATAPRPSCGTCSSRTWSGSGQQYDCNAAGGMPLPDEHHDGVVPDWCPLANAAAPSTTPTTQGA